MKQIFFLLLLTPLLSLQCRKDKPVINSVDQLPPETQSGAQTFGCLINGQVFKPKGPSLSPILMCFYQHLETQDSKGDFFGLAGTDNSKSADVSAVGIYTDSLNLNLGIHQIGSNQKGNYYGIYTRTNQSSSNLYYTSSSMPGVLNITRFDSVSQIVSGTFSYNILTNTGDTLKITNGRFDMHYTR